MKTKRLNQQAGFSLIELMIAAALGFFLMAGMFHIYSANSTSFNMQKASTQIQRNGQFALRVLSQQINTTGYIGFYGDMSQGVDNTLRDKSNVIWDISIPVRGFDQVTASTSIAGISGFVTGTDVLVVKKMVRSTTLKSNSDNKTLTVDSGNDFSPNDILFIADVDQASLFQANQVTTAADITTIEMNLGATVSPGNNRFLANAYSADTEVGLLDVRMYYIKNGKNNHPSLFEAVMANTGMNIVLQETELAANVSDLQLIYGVDGNQDKIVDVYQDAGNVPDWHEVVSVGMALLISSSDPLHGASNNDSIFNMADFTFQNILSSEATADKKLKRTFRAFAPIRNRVL